MDTFKDPTSNNWRTQSLFLELSYHKPENAIYTLGDSDKEFKGKMYLSIKRLYLECEDPTEYEFATKYLGGWQHWQRLCTKTTVLHPYIQEWREELEVKLRSKGLKAMLNHALSERGQQAAKWLAEKGWVEKKRGAPSREEKERELKVQSRMTNEIESDMLRLIK